MRTGKYIGHRKDLRTERALLQKKGTKVIAQFNNMKLKVDPNLPECEENSLGLGWHEFYKSEFKFIIKELWK